MRTDTQGANREKEKCARLVDSPRLLQGTEVRAARWQGTPGYRSGLPKCVSCRGPEGSWEHSRMEDGRSFVEFGTGLARPAGLRTPEGRTSVCAPFGPASQVQGRAK